MTGTFGPDKRDRALALCWEADCTEGRLERRLDMVAWREENAIQSSCNNIYIYKVPWRPTDSQCGIGLLEAVSDFVPEVS